MEPDAAQMMPNRVQMDDAARMRPNGVPMELGTESGIQVANDGRQGIGGKNKLLISRIEPIVPRGIGAL